MQITYKLQDGNLTYDVSEVVMALNFVFNPNGTADRVQVVRRRYFSIMGTPVKEDSAPATFNSMVDLRDVVADPTALTFDQLLTVISLAILATQPELIGQQEVVMPKLPADVGALVQAARLELEQVSLNLATAQEQRTAAEQDLAVVRNLLVEGNQALSNVKAETVRVAKVGDDFKISLVQENQALEAQMVALQTTITTMESNIKSLSEESTTLQLKLQELKKATTE